MWNFERKDDRHNEECAEEYSLWQEWVTVGNRCSVSQESAVCLWSSQWCEVSALKLNPKTKTKVVCLYGSMTNKVVQVKKCRKVTFVCVLVFTHFSVFCLFWFWFKDYKTSSGIIVKLKVIKYFPKVIIIFKKQNAYGSITNKMTKMKM